MNLPSFVVLGLLSLLCGAGCDSSQEEIAQNTSTGESSPAAAAGNAPTGSDPVDSERPVPAKVNSGKPQGLYFMTRYWSATSTLEKAAWYFAPDGMAYENLEGGFSRADLASHAGRKGTLRTSGNKLEITWADGTSTQSTLEPDESSFMWDGGIFTPVRPITGPSSIAGTYEGGESLAHGGNHVAVSRTLDLRPDGTFTWHGISFVKGETDQTVLSAGADGGTSGTWNVSDYSLTLTGSDGSVIRQIAFPYDDEETALVPDRIFFGGTMYKKQMPAGEPGDE